MVERSTGFIARIQSQPKALVLVILAALIIVVLGLSFQPRPIPSALLEVTRGALAETVREEGQTRVQERYEISAPVAAYAPRLELHAGDDIEAGQTLLLLEPLPSIVLDPRTRVEAEARANRARAAQISAESRLEAALATAELAQQELQRIEPLFKKGTVSRSALDQARAEQRRSSAELRSARSGVDVARYDLRQAEAAMQPSSDLEAELEQIPIIAPVSGRVLKIHHESQGVVQAGTPLLCIADPASLEIEIEVLSEDAVRIRPGMAVLIDRWGGEDELQAIVRVVEPGGFTKISALGVEEQRVKVVADLLSPFETWANLGDRYRIEARFILWQDEDVLRAPIGALFRHDEGWAVFAVEDGRARLRWVKPGHWGERQVEIIDGLVDGESVINHPDEAVRDGAKVAAFSSVALD